MTCRSGRQSEMRRAGHTDRMLSQIQEFPKGDDALPVILFDCRVCSTSHFFHFCLYSLFYIMVFDADVDANTPYMFLHIWSSQDLCSVLVSDFQNPASKVFPAAWKKLYSLLSDSNLFLGHFDFPKTFFDCKTCFDWFYDHDPPWIKDCSCRLLEALVSKHISRER